MPDLMSAVHGTELQTGLLAGSGAAVELLDLVASVLRETAAE